MWHDEEAKMGLSLLQILCTSCFILMVMCKESSKPSKLSTKLSTIWQINDYLSKKIDNRLIVDIIDTPGHPANKCFKEENVCVEGLHLSVFGSKD